VKSYVRNIITLSCAKILLTSAINEVAMLENEILCISLKISAIKKGGSSSLTFLHC